MTAKKPGKKMFTKGGKGGPGRPRKKKGNLVPSSQEIRDAFYKAFIEIFVKGGSIKELVSFCKKNQLNTRLLIQEVRKILPDFAIEREEEKGLLYEISERYMPKADARTTSAKDVPTREPESVAFNLMTDEELQKKIKELERKKAGILAALAEKRPAKSKSTN